MGKDSKKKPMTKKERKEKRKSRKEKRSKRYGTVYKIDYNVRLNEA